MELNPIEVEPLTNEEAFELTSSKSISHCFECPAMNREVDFNRDVDCH